MNLIHDPWIPVRRADGSRELICPAALTDRHNPILALDAPRPDFNGALRQFLIGLLQTLIAPQNEDQWADFLERPPTPAELATQFNAVAHAFNLDGEGPRFMQDFKLDGTPAPVQIAGLLMDSVSEHFQRVGTVQGLCWECAAIALFTLQTNAPAGGRGHLTSLRGGGPLTTLVIPDPREEKSGQAWLWSTLWWNVLEREVFLEYLPSGMGDAPADWFPWLSPTRTETITAANGHPALAYWAMPRRIRLDFQHPGAGSCDLCGRESPSLVMGYTTRPNGMNCIDWRHPLSPYYFKADGWLPVHPQPGGLGYRHWPDLAWGHEGIKRIAKVVERAVASRRRLMEVQNVPLRLWGFGYDMEKMKPRCWYEVRMPLLELTDPAHRGQVAAVAEKLVAAATEVRNYLDRSLREAWFDSKNKNKTRGNLGFISQAYWQQTEGDFYRLLEEMARVLRQEEDFTTADQEIRREWHPVLCREAMALFALWATSGAVEHEDPGRIARAYHQLRKNLYGPKLRESILGFTPQEFAQGKKRRNQP